MTDRELMQQALRYMESIGEMDTYPEDWAIAIALRERLAQPEQEPVAWVYPEGLEALKSGRPWTAYGSNGYSRIPLYLNDAVAQGVEPRASGSGAGFESPPASPQWKGLTNQEALNAAVYVFCQLADSPEEQKQIARDLGKACNEPHSALMLFAATIEELLEEKNR